MPLDTSFSHDVTRVPGKLEIKLPNCLGFGSECATYVANLSKTFNVPRGHTPAIIEGVCHISSCILHSRTLKVKGCKIEV